MRLLTSSAILVLGCLLAPLPVAADARADVFELRHGGSPTRHELLGWTTSGDAAFRWIVCSEGGERICRAAVGRFGPSAEHVTETFHYVGYDPVTTLEAIHFIRDENAAITALGTLAPPSAALPDGRRAFGVVGGAPTEVRARIVVTPAFDPGGIVRIAAHGPAGRAELAVLGDASSIDGFSTTAYPSRDGSRVALAFEMVSTTMCWSFADVGFTVADVASVRARL